MLIEQIPTSSSSSDASAESGDRETSFQAQVENSSPSSQLSLQTSAAAPPPAVDEETLRRLDKILRSIPSEMDNAAAYAALKAKLGISRFKEHASSSETKIPPSSPTSPSPSPIQPPPSPIAKPSPPSPTFTPIQPVKYGGEASDEEGWREDYGQPFAIPSPTSGGGSISIHEPHLTGGGEINDEEEEDLHPLFDYREAEKEEEPPSRQTRNRSAPRGS
ncbi:WASH complex subunit 3-like [Salvia splendens]|uniref:WASH complex subunit 3-like n=1 Tax=Salvia splendens TaxID=180675 RepID=UPI001C26624E|nr:WASH complex subunit 3-like [Salvia splendens]